MRVNFCLWKTWGSLSGASQDSKRVVFSPQVGRALGINLCLLPSWLLPRAPVAGVWLGVCPHDETELKEKVDWGGGGSHLSFSWEAGRFSATWDTHIQFPRRHLPRVPAFPGQVGGTSVTAGTNRGPKTHPQICVPRLDTRHAYSTWISGTIPTSAPSFHVSCGLSCLLSLCLSQHLGSHVTWVSDSPPIRGLTVYITPLSLKPKRLHKHCWPPFNQNKFPGLHLCMWRAIIDWTKGIQWSLHNCEQSHISVEETKGYRILSPSKELI
jgi:hypothetical protein